MDAELKLLLGRRGQGEQVTPDESACVLVRRIRERRHKEALPLRRLYLVALHTP